MICTTQQLILSANSHDKGYSGEDATDVEGSIQRLRSVSTGVYHKPPS